MSRKTQGRFRWGEMARGEEEREEARGETTWGGRGKGRREKNTEEERGT